LELLSSFFSKYKKTFLYSPLRCGLLSYDRVKSYSEAMEQKDVKYLLLKYQAGNATEQEKTLIENWMLYGAAGDIDLTDKELLHDLIEIRQRLKIDEPQRKVALWPRITAAAIVLIFLSIGGYLLLNKQPPKQPIADKQLHNDAAPGGNKATLTLANGRQISLTDAKPGILISQDNTIINKTAQGEIVYKVTAKNITGQIAYNTITIPRTGKWAVILPDGSKAWLDAASSIRFPIAFTGADRTVQITGQVYFEVVHNAAQPFRVIANGETIEDIGTHFNVNAYSDEPVVKTTLLEGSVKVSKNDQKVILKPGQQSVTSSINNNILVKETETEDAVAWKEGYFNFKKASIQTVMREFARWYDVEVKYEGKTPTSMITGKVPRDVKASQALKILSYLDIHFRIEDKTITITP
jgi:hypothetical protein